MEWQTIAGVLGAIVLLGNAGAVIFKWIRPALDVKKRVEDLERKTANDYKAILELKRTVEKCEQVNRIHLTVLLNTVNHMIDGNGTDEFKKTRDDIVSMLADIKTIEQGS